MVRVKSKSLRKDQRPYLLGDHASGSDHGKAPVLELLGAQVLEARGLGVELRGEAPRGLQIGKGVEA